MIAASNIARNMIGIVDRFSRKTCVLEADSVLSREAPLYLTMAASSTSSVVGLWLRIASFPELSGEEFDTDFPERLGTCNGRMLTDAEQTITLSCGQRDGTMRGSNR